MEDRLARQTVQPGNLRSSQTGKPLAEEDSMNVEYSFLPSQARFRLWQDAKLTSRSHTALHVSGAGRGREDRHITQKGLMKAFPAFVQEWNQISRNQSTPGCCLCPPPWGSGIAVGNWSYWHRGPRQGIWAVGALLWPFALEKTGFFNVWEKVKVLRTGLSTTVLLGPVVPSLSTCDFHIFVFILYILWVLAKISGIFCPKLMCL